MTERQERPLNGGAPLEGVSQMQEFKYIHHLPGKSLEGGVELLNSLSWNISCREENGTWWVRGGDQAMLKTDSREAAEAFLYGMALAYSMCPPEMLEQIRRLVAE